MDALRTGVRFSREGSPCKGGEESRQAAAAPARARVHRRRRRRRPCTRHLSLSFSPPPQGCLAYPHKVVLLLHARFRARAAGVLAPLLERAGAAAQDLPPIDTYAILDCGA